MTQTQEKQDTPLTMERAEQMLTRAGGQVGILAGRAMQRFRQTTQAFHEGAGHMDMSASGHQVDPDATARKRQLAMKRAETLVDQLEQRVGYWAVLGSLQMTRTLAHVQEEAEDIWVEAQNMRYEWKSKANPD
jgi:hypothetical protein